MLAFLLATLTIHCTSGGKPVAARVYLTDAAGKAIRIPGTIGVARKVETNSTVDGSASLELLPGRYTVRAEKGLEFRPAQKTVEIGSEPTRVDLDLPRYYDMNQRGWYSGDLHIHRDPAELPLLARAEDLNIAPTITRHVGNPRAVETPFPSSNEKRLDATHVVTFQNQEVERLGKGHGAVLLLNDPEPVPVKLTDLFPMDVEFCRKARGLGAFIDGEKPIWKNVPVNVAFGVLDTIGVVNNHFHPRDTMLSAESWGSMERDKPEYKTVAGFAQWMIDLYYSFLNCGFRIPVSAGSASGVMASWIGYERVYVHLSGPFSLEQWFRDLKAGRSVATNGPLLEVEVNGKAPGAVFEWKPGARAKVHIGLHSQDPVERTEVVFNARVVRTLKPADAPSTELDIPLDEPGWLAVRCFGPAGETIRYAHSSPFYFLKDGKLPVRKEEAKRWADYVHGLAAAAGPEAFTSKDDYDRAQATWHEAEAIYRRLAR